MNLFCIIILVIIIYFICFLLFRKNHEQFGQDADCRAPGLKGNGYPDGTDPECVENYMAAMCQTCEMWGPIREGDEFNYYGTCQSACENDCDACC